MNRTIHAIAFAPMLLLGACAGDPPLPPSGPSQAELAARSDAAFAAQQRALAETEADDMRPLHACWQALPHDMRGSDVVDACVAGFRLGQNEPRP